MQKAKRITQDAQIIGANLRLLREGAGLSQHDLAGMLDVSYQQIQKYEMGQNRLPIERLFKLKQLYGIPYEYFFKNITKPPAVARKIDSAKIYEHLAGIKNENFKKTIERVLLILLDYNADADTI